MKDRDRAIAIDTEFNYRKDPFIATSCDWQLKTGLYNFHSEEEKDQLRKIAEDRSIVKIMFPMTVDWYVLGRIGIKCKGDFEDPLVAGTLLDENFANRKGLKAMAQRYLDADIKEAKELGKLKRKYKKLAKERGIEFDYSLIPSEVLHPYAVEDSVFTQKLWFLFRDPIKKFDSIYQIEKKVACVIVKMQEFGMMVDRPFVKKQSAQYKKDIKECYGRIQALFKQNYIKLPEFNPNSPKQVAFALEKSGIRLPRNMNGNPVTNEKVLSNLDEHKIVSEILLNRFIKKQDGTYFEPLETYYTTVLDPYAHFFVFGSGARTGRTSAELIQTIPRPEASRTANAPKLARQAFRPRLGYVFLAIDYKALQMLIFFHFAKAKKLIDKCREGWDPHDATCQMLFGKVDKLLRRDTKGINFGIIFGMGKDKLVRVLRMSEAKKEVTQFEAHQILQKYYSIVPVKEFSRECIGRLYREGVLKLEFDSDLMSFHREYRVPKEFAYKGPNVLIQGTEAYVVKHAMIRCDELIQKKGIDAHQLMCVHDELLFEVSEKEPIPLIVKELEKTMEDHVSLSVPLRVESKISRESWGKVEKWEEVKDRYQRRKAYGYVGRCSTISS